MLKRLWSNYRNACLLTLALLVISIVVSPWVLLAALLPVGWVVLKTKPAKADQPLTITEEDQMSKLIIKLEGFSIERALSGKEKDGKKFLDLISDSSNQINESKLADCLDPYLELEQLNADTSPFPEQYMKEGNFPKATLIKISNIEKNEEDSTILFDVIYEFDNFLMNNKEAGLEALNFSHEEIATYIFQVKEDILIDYGLRNNRFDIPKVEIEYEIANINNLSNEHIRKIIKWSLTKGSGEEEIASNIFANGVIMIAGEESDKTARYIFYELDSNINTVNITYESKIGDKLKDSVGMAFLNSKNMNLINSEQSLYNQLIMTAIKEDSSELDQNTTYRENYIFESADSSYFSEAIGNSFNDTDKTLIGCFCSSVNFKYSEAILDINETEKLLKIAIRLINDPSAINELEGQTHWHGVHLVPVN